MDLATANQKRLARVGKKERERARNGVPIERERAGEGID